MLEIIIERWDNADGSSSFFWSLWQSGRRIHIGGKSSAAVDAKQEALAFCRDRFRAPPDRLREL